jgi:hypothetical protein
MAVLTAPVTLSTLTLPWLWISSGRQSSRWIFADRQIPNNPFSSLIYQVHTHSCYMYSCHISHSSHCARTMLSVHTQYHACSHTVPCMFTHSTMHVHTQYHARSHTVPCMFTHSTMHAHTQCHACSHTVPCMFTHSAMYCCHQMAQYVRVLTVKQLPKFLSFLTACEVNCLNC